MEMAYNYKDIKSEYKLTSDGDSWGHCLCWLFAIADEIYFNRCDEISVPDKWQFRPSCIGPSNDPESYETEIVEGTETHDLLQFGQVLHRYADRLKRAGKDY